ncbi:MAG TPA: M1 family aminopeptidase [Polyangiaceae bacterium]|jgi:aminopeptidase N|nr:M1 family aminopeptidase [Polyangiaceae bacterium]
MSSRLHARCACSGLGAPFALAGTTRKYERSRPFTIKHLFLDLTLDIAKKSVRGSATLDFERLSHDAERLVLDAIGFQLEGVELVSGDGVTPLEHDYDGDRLSVALGGKRRGKLKITYAATPRRGLYFLAPDGAVKDRPRQVWSQCQDEDARYWFPCLDKPHVKMTSELRIAVPPGWVALSNGEPRPVEKPKGRGRPWVYHFALNQPHPAYLVTLVAGELAVVEDRAAELGHRKIPVSYFVPPKRKKDVARSLGDTPRMIELFSERTGVPFPWSRYSQVVVSDFIFGGMENTTATTLYEHVLLDERASLDVSSHDLVAHELAHQWFGDFVTCRDWSHGWLNEGFATFFEHIEREARLGRDEYDYGIVGDLELYLGEANGRYQRPIVCRDYQEPIDLFDRHLYQKGGLVLHMLRRKLGDDAFWDGVRLYLQRHAHGIVETNDLMRALEEASSKSLERFFDSWVYRPGHPDLRVKIGYEDGLLNVEVKQKQRGSDVATFAFPVEVLVKTKGGALERHEKIVNETTDTLVVALPERPAFVVFDPDLRVPTAVELDAPADFLRRQLEGGPSAYARWTAARSLADRDDLRTVEALAAALASAKEAWMVRAEAARALGRLRGEAAFDALGATAHDKHPKVRRAVAEALGAFRTPAAARILKTLAQSDKSYLVAGDAARALGRTRQPGVLKDLMAVLDRPSWADTQRSGALHGMAELRDESAVPTVMARSRYGVPTRSRRVAVSALAQLSDSRRTREHLEELLDDRDPHFRISVIDALRELGDTKARGALRRALERELDGRVTRRLREALRDLGEAGAHERKRLGDELETVRGELAELKQRLAKLEAKPAAARSGKGAHPPAKKRR